MSTIINPMPPVMLPSARERYRYGWRDIFHELPDGTRKHEQIPLTVEDTLHPQLGDFVVEGPYHDEIRMYLTGVFRSRLVADKTTFVLSNCGVYWNHPDFGHHAADISVLFGLADPEAIWDGDSYSVKKFGMKPKWIVEIVSRHIRNNDVVTKFNDYHVLGIPRYVIVDRIESDVDWKIIGYEHTPRRYLPMPTDERGRLWLEDLGVWLGVEKERVVCYDGESDAVILDHVSSLANAASEKARAEVEKARAEAEKARAEAAEKKLQELEAELARLRGS